MKLNFKSLLPLLVISGVITVILKLGTAIYLVPPRYAEGDIITQTIIINDAVTLEDVRSTALRRKEALGEFPPIYDFDTRLKERMLANLNTGFANMREQLAALRRGRADTLGKIRRNALNQISALAEFQSNRTRLRLVRKEKRQLIDLMGLLNDLSEPTEDQRTKLEKARFDLKAVDAHLAAANRAGSQLEKKREQLLGEAAALMEASQDARIGEEQTHLNMNENFGKQLGVPADAEAFAVLRAAQFAKELEGNVVALLGLALEQKIVSGPESRPTNRKVIQIQELAAKEQAEAHKPKRFEELDTIVDIQQVRDEIDRRGQELKYPGDGSGQREAVISIAQALVRPTLTENKGETERQKQELAVSLSPVYFNLKKGDVVARAKDTATAQQVDIIRALNTYNRKNPKYPQLVGTFIIVLLLLVMIQSILTAHFGAENWGLSRFVLGSILMVVTLLLAQGILAIVPALTTLEDFIPPNTYNLLIPAALASMLAGIMLGVEAALFLGFATSLFLAILLGNSLGFFIYSMMGSVVASIPLRNYDTRYALWQQGLRISAINVPVLVVLTLLEQSPLGMNLAVDIGAGLINGLWVALLTSTILPLLEKAFDITTNMRLLELSNMNHPALKDLAVRAPGTYHHSIVVGNLSESAAGGIQANPLLVRVAAYYHDLGKMMCPLYFVENQMRKNYHDDLPAKTSTRIIINHVKDGLELAKKYKLGSTITNIIAQHHGSSLVRFFFHKAGEESDDSGDTLLETEFRYPGPKPQTKAAGLVMVADVTEAATRSLADPSPEAIRELVQKLATSIYMDGQLDESGMTFNDLNYVEKTFTKMLLSIHHHRINYPELEMAPKAREGEDSAASEDEQPKNRNFLGKRRAASRTG
ncbi:MAG: HDIG domain-containing metalloprotein [bacterium]